MKSLAWPDAFYQPAPSSRLKRFFTPYANFAQVKEALDQQLRERPRPDPHLWGDDPVRVKTGSLLCKLIEETYQWPNDHFLPDDPFDIACLLPWDDLDIVELTMSLEENLDRTIEDAKVLSWAGASLRGVVESLLDPQELGSEPPPIDGSI
jgi:acyl carrier protein